jgi:hypothetical protein
MIINALTKPITAWHRLGHIIEQGKSGEFDSGVLGDPCIVWDSDRECHHMFYFAQAQTDSGELNCNAHAVSTKGVGPGVWQKRGPLVYENAEDLCGDTHKPWILMDPYHPNRAAQVDGKYWLFTVSFRGLNKVIQAATATTLDGPWLVTPQPVVDLGDEDAFDGYHVDAVSAYWFEEQGKILIYYMGYPRDPQADQTRSPFGSSNAVAVLQPGERSAKKMGKIIAPSTVPNHWTAGYVGGLQILPAADGGWYGILNASPTPPAPVEEEPMIREPAPSLGGWAHTSEQYPVKGWQAMEEPIEWINDIPQRAIRAGEGVNLWRHHLVLLPNRSIYLLYNTGSYGNERLFGRYVPGDDSLLIERVISVTSKEDMG